MTKHVETYKEFTFEAAHETPPFSKLHGHSFRVGIHLTGEPDPVYGWPANLYEVDRKIASLRETLDDSYLNDIKGLEVPSLENVAAWIWESLQPEFPGLDRIEVSRGSVGHAEGCVYRG